MYLEPRRAQTLYDPLTGLPNPQLLMDRLEQAIYRAERPGRMIAVVFFDLNDFRKGTKQYGWTIGDKLLVHIADRLSSSLRRTDTVARMGEETFVAVLENLPSKGDVDVAACKVLSALKSAFSSDGKEITIHTRSGVGVYPGDGKTPQDLIDQAERKCQQGKASLQPH